MPAEVTVALGDRSYGVCIGATLGGLGARIAALAPRVVIVTDEHVAPLWLEALHRELAAAGVAAAAVVLPAGEPHKTVQTWSQCLDEVLAHGVDRRTPLVALGGGVVGDITGFAAASLLRGLPFVQVPTTSLAMVDSSVGGKTGVNHARGKNLVGAFHQPALVWAATETLRTLPDRELRAGLAEVVKVAVVRDATLLDLVERDASALLGGDPESWERVVAHAVRLKAEIVGEDERESGPRMLLNAGHTVGHALEAALGYGVLLHGEAVAIGLVAEATFALRRGWLDDSGLPDRLRDVLSVLGLPTAVPAVSPDTVRAAMVLDKKATGDMLTLPVPVAAGRARFVRVPSDELASYLQELA